MSHGRVVCLSCWLCSPWNHLQLFSYKGSPNLPRGGLLCLCQPFWDVCWWICWKSVHTYFSAGSVWLDTRVSTVNMRWMSASSSPARTGGRASTSSITSSAPAHQELGVGSSAIKWMLQEGIFLSGCWFHRHSLKGMHYVLWRMFPKYTGSLEIHIFSLKINAAFFPSLLIFFLLKE